MHIIEIDKIEPNKMKTEYVKVIAPCLDRTAEKYRLKSQGI